MTSQISRVENPKAGEIMKKVQQFLPTDYLLQTQRSG